MVGALLTAGVVTGLMVVLVCGAVMDRVGARLVLGMILLGQVVAEVALAWAHNTLTALPAVFLLPAQDGGDARMRIFTPAAELAFAGAPVLGTAFVEPRHGS